MTKEEAAQYLAGAFDGEGCIAIYYASEKWPSDNRVCRIGNTTPYLVDACAECCDVLGIEYTRTSRKSKRGDVKSGELHFLDIYKRASLERFIQVVPLRDLVKREKFNEVVSTYRRNPK
jgi:LAGLIDADG-like domain